MTEELSFILRHDVCDGMPRFERTSYRKDLPTEEPESEEEQPFYHCYDLSNISEYAQVGNATFKLMKRNLPGPFTFILKADSRLPKIFRNRKEVGIRVPDNTIIREICRLLEAPILTTTLPLREGEDIEYITDPELIDEKFGEEVDLIIDGGIGGIEPSTVINCCEDIPEIVRQGKGELEV